MISCVAVLPLALVLNSAGPLNAAARPAGHARSHAIKLAVDASTFATPASRTPKPEPNPNPNSNPNPQPPTPGLGVARN